ncbi:DUF6434 domain-containing protein [Georgenia sp. MJ170]|uniref:DUF6434 domain-containing protein n=1 Tax=Georgenia sunbinii TaxID=3117728 RepID=UPI002F26AF5A
MAERTSPASGPQEARPPLASVMSGAELRRWYWLRSELVDRARQLGVARHGSKTELLDRLAAALDGAPAPARPPPRRAATRQLAEPVGPATVLPPGQRCSQVLRRFFAAEVGPAFRFDEHMRDFIAHGAGRTLAEAVDHWHRTRGAAIGPIGEQFEYNRFTRQWFAGTPDGSRQECMAAWQVHRALPVDRRPPVPGGR